MANQRKSALLKDQLEFYWPQMRRKFRSRRNTAGLTKSVAKRALELLNSKLSIENRNLACILVGGGAMMFFDARGNTDDLDVIPSPSNPETQALIQRLALEVRNDLVTQGVELPNEWINTGAEPMFTEQAKQLRAGDVRPFRELDFSNLHIYIAMPIALLTTKLYALRHMKDWKDVLRLCEMLGIRNYDGLLRTLGDRLNPEQLGNDEIEQLKKLLG